MVIKKLTLEITANFLRDTANTLTETILSYASHRYKGCNLHFSTQATVQCCYLTLTCTSNNLKPVKTEYVLLHARKSSQNWGWTEIQIKLSLRKYTVKKNCMGQYPSCILQRRHMHIADNLSFPTGLLCVCIYICIYVPLPGRDFL